MKFRYFTRKFSLNTLRGAVFDRRPRRRLGFVNDFSSFSSRTDDGVEIMIC
jgi:hypothetical protein